MASIVQAIGRQPKRRIVGVAFAVVGLLWIGDWWTGPDVSFLIFYSAPVLVVAWFAGWRAAVGLSLMSACGWYLDDLLGGYPQGRVAISYWNIAADLAFFVAVSVVVHLLRQAQEGERRAIEEGIAREIEIAREVQATLFPKDPPKIRGLRGFGRCEAARGVGGDYFDFLPYGEDALGIAVGDVAGKGISAALMMASLQALLRSLAPLHGENVAALIADVNRRLHASSPDTKYATLFYGRYEVARRRLVFVNAGHPAALLLRRGEDAPIRLESTGTVVGLFPTVVYREEEVVLGDDDILVLFTDGISEATSPGDEEFGLERIERILARSRDLDPDGIGERLFSEVRSFVAGGVDGDDQTVVVVKGVADEAGAPETA
jgi:sigma-B regulation protein RsbU (phosphoserine phosphatase)